MRGRISTSTKVFAVTFVCGVLGAIYGAVSLVKKYPWTAPTTNFAEAKSSLFFEPFPQSAMEEERLARKNLRRFPKQEQKRRQDIQLRRMRVVNSALSDIFIEGSAQFTAHVDPLFQALSGTPWPVLDLARSVGVENEVKRNLSYILLPGQNTTELTEALLLNAGEEIRLSYAITKNRRTVSFNVFPVVPSNVRALVGQYSSWGKSFGDLEVNTISNVQIPVSDATAGTLRLQCVMGSFYLMEAKVTQREGSGRMPIQIAGDSPMWRSNSKFFSSSGGEVKEADEAEIEAAEEGGEPIAPAQAEEEKEKSAAPAPVNLPIEIPDDERANIQVPSSVGRTTALGYNVVLFQLESIPWEIVSDPAQFRMLAPNLANFASQSFQVLGKLDVPESGDELFRRMILGTSPSRSFIENPALLSQLLLDPREYNFYARLRSFGYHVAGIAPASAYGANPAISWAEGFPRLAGRWLDESDWNMFRKRRDLDAVREPVSGLDAVFPTKSLELAPPLSTAEYGNMGAYLQRALKTGDVPDWRANELFFPDGRKLYFARVVDTFQSWIKENLQTRFFLHVDLDGRNQKSRSSLRDFWKVLKARRIRAFTDAKKSEQLARIVHLDRAFGQMVDALTAKRLEHRTVVAVVLPHASKLALNSQGASFFLKVPGLLPKRERFIENMNLDDVASTVATTVGIPLGSNVSDSVEPFGGRALELKLESGTQPTTQARKSAVRQYHAYIFPSETGCDPFEWYGDTPIFGVQASLPIVEVNPSKTVLRIFPCALSAPLVRLSWYQNLQPPMKIDGTQEGVESSLDARKTNILGGFFYSGKKADDLSAMPLFLFGRHFYKITDIPFTLKNVSKKELVQLFDVEEQPDANDESVLKHKLSLMSRMMSETEQKRTIVFFARSTP